MKKCFFLFFLMLSCTTASFAQSLMGDVNGDNKVDFKDVSEISNYIMGKPSANFDETKADINGDTKINAADLVRVINMAMVTLYDSYSLVVWKSDGTKDYYNISELPETTFGDAIHVVKTSGGETKAYDKEEVLRYSFSLKDNPNDPKPEQNQNAREAFYVYQNDGHFEGFFYDEVQKIAFSEVDTFGIAHDGIVSQEIVTADSTYRFMLTAIDSIGFVQPDIIFNPRLHTFEGIENFYGGQWYAERYIDYSDENNPVTSVHIYHDYPSNLPKLPQELYPQPGDVLANFDITYGWSDKVVSVEENDGEIIAYTKPIDDITDIFHQFVAVERYSHDDQGNLLSRRVAGRPELTIGRASTRASGDFDYNLLNFSINGHIPLLNELDGTDDDISISIDPSIQGKVDIRVVYDLSFWGSKYIGITTDVALGASVGVNIDGPIKKVMSTGLGKFALIPLPTATPILTLDICPDGFIRAEGHFHVSVTSPTASCKFWVKLEIKDWWPSMNFGAGSSNPDKDEEETVNNNPMKASVELNGFVQSGTLFPMKVKSLPLIKNLFDSTIGGTWYVGPKFSGALNINLANMLVGDNDIYNNIKDSKISLSLMDFDYEVTAEVKSAFSDKKEWTLLDGTLNLWPSFDLHLFPNFEDCETYKEMSTQLHDDGSNVTLDCYAFNPEGNVFLPQTVGVGLFYVNEKGKEELLMEQYRDNKYYQLENREIESKYTWPALKIWSGYLENLMTNYNTFNPETGTLRYETGKFRVRPLIDTGLLLGADEYGLNYGIVKATPVYDIEVDRIWETSCDTLFVNYDCSINTPVNITGLVDGVSPVDPINNNPYGIDKFPDWLIVSGAKGDIELSVDQAKLKAKYGKNYSLTDTLWVEYGEDDVIIYMYAKFGTNTVVAGPHCIKVAILPNNPNLSGENPASFSIGVVPITGDYDTGVSFGGRGEKYSSVNRNGDVWHCSYNQTTTDNRGGSITLTATFDIVSSYDRVFTIKNGNLYYNDSWQEIINNETKTYYEKVLWTFDDIPLPIDYREGYGYGQAGGSGDFTVSVKKYADTVKTAKGKGTPGIGVFFRDYIDSHPEEFQ